MKRKIFIAGIVTIVIIVIIGIKFFYYKPHPDYEKELPEFKLTASNLYNQFIESDEDFGKIYNGKVLQITGDLSKVERNGSTYTLVFTFNEGVFGDEGIRCNLLPNYSVQESLINKNIIVKGYCAGYNGTDVILEFCSITY